MLLCWWCCCVGDFVVITLRWWYCCAGCDFIVLVVMLLCWLVVSLWTARCMQTKVRFPIAEVCTRSPRTWIHSGSWLPSCFPFYFPMYFPMYFPIYIRRPWPSPRQGRRLGPPEVWNLLCHSPLLLRHSSLPLPGFKRLKLLKPSKSLAPPATKPLQTFKTLTTLQLLHCFLAAAATKPSGRQPLLLQGCSLPFACTSLAAASTKLLAVSVPALQPALCLHITLSC